MSAPGRNRSEGGAACRGAAGSHAARLAEAPLRLAEAAGHRRDRGLSVHRLAETAARTHRLAKATTGVRGLPESATARVHRLAKAATARVHRLPESATAGVHRLAKATRPGLAGRAECATAGPSLGRRRQIDEGPLVVLVHPVINLDRRVLALRGHALDTHRRLGARRAAAERPARSRPGCLPAAKAPESAATRRCPLLAGAEPRRLVAGLLPWQPDLAGRHRTAHRDDLEVFVGNRILVFLPQEPLLNQYVECRGKRVGEAPLEQHDGAPVLLTAPDQLFLAFASGRLAPHRERGRHHHRHHAQAHQQGGHGVSPLGRVRALTR